MRNTIKATLASATLLFGTTCGAMAANLQGQTIKVGSDLTYPPYDYFENKQPAGFDSEFMSLLAESGEFKTQFVDTRFENLILGVNSNKFDVIASALYVKPTRAKQIDFIPYMKTGVSIAVSSYGSFRPDVPEDLCGKRVSLIKGAAYKANLQEVSDKVCSLHDQKIDVREFPTSPEATQAVLSGNVDAQMDDSAVLKLAQQKTGTRLTISSKENLFPVLIGMGISKQNPEMKMALEDAFEKIKANGKYHALLKRYNVSEPSSQEIKSALGL